MDVVHGSFQCAFITQVLIAEHAKENDSVTLFVLVHCAIKILAGG
jgi:hypothetical protein